jgi:hypothetical protein
MSNSTGFVFDSDEQLAFSSLHEHREKRTDKLLQTVNDSLEKFCRDFLQLEFKALERRLSQICMGLNQLTVTDHVDESLAHLLDRALDELDYLQKTEPFQRRRNTSKYLSNPIEKEFEWQRSSFLKQERLPKSSPTARLLRAVMLEEIADFKDRKVYLIGVLVSSIKKKREALSNQNK